MKHMLALAISAPTNMPRAICMLVFTMLLLVISRPVPAREIAPERTKATIVSVSDGDTIVVKIQSSRERVRLIGIDTPESHMNKRALKQSGQTGTDLRTIISFGERAASFSKSLLSPGATVLLEFDTERRDRYQRLLAYVWLRDGRMLNDVIIRSGYAYPLTIPPNVKYRERFSQAFSESRVAKRGLWADPS